jgi:NAD(P)-dependent dehydrogenase (short-subunit alcohol dehydrogenase family)
MDGKRVLVTGAARGVGLALALDLAENGALVLGADLRHSSDELAAAGVELVGADLSSEQGAEVMAAAARDVLGGLDALVNNAGVVDLERRPFWEIAASEWDRVLAVNARGPWLCSRAALPLLRDSDGGAIVNVASEAAFTTPTQRPARTVRRLLPRYRPNGGAGTGQPDSDGSACAP